MRVKAGAKKLDRGSDWDTIQHLEAASKSRFEEAEFLAGGGFRLLAIYVYGYSVEMRLKTACYRLAGFGVKEQVDKDKRSRVAKTLNGNDFPHHDLKSWSDLLIKMLELRDQRSSRKNSPITRGIAPDLLRAIAVNTRVVHESWSPDLRYRTKDVKAQELENVRASSSWIQANYTKIRKSF